MNKHIVLLILITLCNTTLLPLSSQEARLIRKNLYSQYDNGVITYAQLAEPGMTMQDVIERDLQVMIEHKQKLQLKLDGYKGFFVRRFVPGLRVVAMFVTGTISSVTGLFAYGGSVWVNNTIKKGDLQTDMLDGAINFTDPLVEYFSQKGMLSQKDVKEYNEEVMRYKVEKFQRMDRENPGFKEVAVLAPFAAMISAISGLLFLSSLYSLCTYKGKITAAMEKVQKRFNRDQAIIGQLKELQYTLGHNL